MRKTESDTAVPDYAQSSSCSPPCPWIDAALAAGVTFISWIVYLCTLAPTVTGEDSGELITAAYSLGIAHPPGYPLWCLLGRLFCFIPYGEAAWRVNLMSATFAAAAVFLLFYIVLMLTRNRPAAAGGALAFAFSWEFWEQSVIAEVYSLNTFCLALCLVLLWRWHATRRDCLLYVFAVIYGLSLGNHYTMVLVGPLFAVFILCADRARLRRWKTYWAVLGLAALSSFVIYLYLPIRSAANPAMDWGNPETLANWWRVVRREQYAFMLTQYPRSMARFLRQVACCAGFWWAQFTPWVGIFGLFGLAVLLRRRFWYGLLLLVIGLTVPTGFTLAQNFNFDREWLWVMTVFSIPAYLVTAVGIGVGLDAVHRRVGGFYLSVPLAAVCILSPLAANWHANDKSDYYWTDDYARNVLATLPLDAIYIPDSDHGCFPVIYLQAVHGLRPDVTLGRRYGYVDMDIVADMPPERCAILGEFPRGRDEPEIFAWLLAHTARPVYFTTPPKLAKGSDIRFERTGLLYRALGPAQTIEQRNYWAEYRWRTLDPAATRGDNTAELILCEIAFAQAAERLAKGETDAGLAFLEQGLNAYGRDVVALNNAGVICARNSLAESARRYFQDALDRDPENPAAAKNLARLDAPRP